MKTKLPLIAALYCGLCSVGSAFTLDFSGLNVGDTLPQTIFVPGYGSVSFAATNGTLEIKKFAPGAQNAIAFDFAESISITFNNAVPINVTNQYIGVNPGESFAFLPDAIDPKVFSLTMAGASPSGAAGLQSVVFDQVPEPSTSLLGAMGVALLVVRRRR